VQAAGRVIRTPSDEGVVYLIDDRFVLPGVRRLLPHWWKIERFPYPEKQKRQADLPLLRQRLQLKS
jgi:Rad3-related DNA helicase